MRRRSVNRAVVLVLGVATTAVGAGGLMAGPLHRFAPAGLPLPLAPGRWWATLTSLLPGGAGAALIALAAALAAIAAGLAVLSSQLRPGRARGRRRADLELMAPDDQHRTILRGRALSAAVADDVTRAPEVLSADVTSWQDGATSHVDVEVSLARGIALGEVDREIRAALTRARRSLADEDLRATVTIDVMRTPPPRVR